MLEPSIGYGAFNIAGHPIQPGEEPRQIGYGIFNGFPEQTYGVYELPNHEHLEYYMTKARRLWETKKADLAFDAIPNKWETLIGLRTQMFQHAADYIKLYVELEDDWPLILIRYPQVHVVLGISTLEQVKASLDVGRIVAVDGDVITNEDGLKWAPVPRFTQYTDAKPEWDVSSETKAALIRNLDKVLAQRDSE